MEKSFENENTYIEIMDRLFISRKFTVSCTILYANTSARAEYNVNQRDIELEQLLQSPEYLDIESVDYVQCV